MSIFVISGGENKIRRGRTADVWITKIITSSKQSALRRITTTTKMPSYYNRLVVNTAVLLKNTIKAKS